MSIKITPPVNPILGPLAVFCIILGVVSMIGLPLLQAFLPISHHTRRLVLLGAAFVAAISGSVYSVLYARKASSTLSVVDAGIYYLFWPVLFFSIFGLGVFLSSE
jgi:hypothetical protein